MADVIGLMYEDELRKLRAATPAPMSREAARILADRLEKIDDPTIRSPDELQLILAALRYYGKPK